MSTTQRFVGDFGFRWPILKATGLGTKVINCAPHLVFPTAVQRLDTNSFHILLENSSHSMFARSITTCSLSFQQVLPPVKFRCMWLECKRHFDPVSSLLQNVEHAKMGRWASKWEHPVHPWGIWLECNLPAQEKWLLRKETFKAFFWYIHVALVHRAPAFISSLPSLAPLAPGAEWPLLRVPLGTLVNGIMRKLSVRQREWKRLVPVWLKSLMRYVSGFQSNSKSGIISDQVVTFGCRGNVNGRITVYLQWHGQKSFNDLPEKLQAKYFSKFTFHYISNVGKDDVGSHLILTTSVLEIWVLCPGCTQYLAHSLIVCMVWTVHRSWRGFNTLILTIGCDILWYDCNNN